jgi:hypothetical protein
VSVVEKQAPSNRTVGRAVAGVAVVVAVIVAIVWLARGSPSDGPDAAPATTAPASSSIIVGSTFAGSSLASTRPADVVIDAAFEPGASYRIYLHRAIATAGTHVFAYIDTVTRELRYLGEQQLGRGTVVGSFGRMLVLRRAGPLLIADRELRGPFTPIAEGDRFVGAWRNLAIVAEGFADRTTFHHYDESGRAVRSIGLVGPAPDVVGGVVRDSIVVERAGRIIIVSLLDASVREFATGHLIGVGGDRVVYSACDAEACAILETTLDRVVGTIPIGPYVLPGYDHVQGQVAPDGTAIVLVEQRTGGEVVLSGGTRFPVSVEGGPRPYAWAPTSRLYVVDGPARQLDVVDWRTGRVDTVPLPREITDELHSVAVW